MTDQNTQTAVDAPNAPAQPGAAGGQDAQTGADALDTLLSEFDSKTAPSTTNPPAQPQAAGDDLRAIADEVRAWRTEKQQDKFNRDMTETVGKLRGDLDPEVFDDSLVRGYVNARADQDPRLAQAWVDRHTNPKAFQRVVEQLGREFRQKFSKLPDKGATEDHAAVTAAVRGASHRAPEAQAPNYSRLTDAELQAEKDKLFG